MSNRSAPGKPGRNIILILIVSLFLGCCTSPLEQEYEESTMEEDIRAIGEQGDLDTADVFLLGMYLTIGRLQGNDHQGKTYAEILQEAKEFQKEKKTEEAARELVAERMKKEEETHLEELRNTVGITLLDKGFKSADWQDYITFRFAFENRSAKDIRALKGTVVFTDLFDEKIYSLKLTYDEQIPAGETVSWNVLADYNSYMNKDVLLNNKRLDDLKIRWEPEKIIFTDNTTL